VWWQQRRIKQLNVSKHHSDKIMNLKQLGTFVVRNEIAHCRVKNIIKEPLK